MEMATTGDNRRVSFWSWPGPAGLYVGLVTLAVWTPILVFGRNSDLVLAFGVAATICASLAYQAVRKPPYEWSLYLAWVMRISAIVTACWLFAVTPAMIGRFIAVAVFAVLYVLCERAVWRRVRADRNRQK